MLAGRPHEAAGHGSPRWMAAGPRERAHRIRPTGRLARRLICLNARRGALTLPHAARREGAAAGNTPGRRLRDGSATRPVVPAVRPVARPPDRLWPMGDNGTQIHVPLPVRYWDAAVTQRTPNPFEILLIIWTR